MRSNLIIEKPTLSEYKKSIKMLNKIFMLSFPILIPKLYGKGKDYSKEHYIVKQEDKIVGAIASVPNTFNIDGEILKAKGVGMVGTRYSARGQGIMTLMLETIYKDAIENETDILFLSGNFNRYERFGFYPSGITNVYRIRKNKADIKKAKEYNFVAIKNNSNDLKEIENIYKQQDIRCNRDDFYNCLKNWRNKAYFIYKNGELKGYLVESHKNHIYEIITMNVSVVEVITAYLTIIGRDSIEVEVSPYLRETNIMLLNQCECCTQRTNESWSILNMRHTLEVLLNAKMKREPLHRGKVVLKVDSEIFLVEVLEKEARVSIVDKTPDVELTRGVATRILFGVNQGFETGNELLDSWLPVALYISPCDTM